MYSACNCTYVRNHFSFCLTFDKFDWVRSRHLNVTFEWKCALMTEQTEHVIKTRLNHLFISRHGKKIRWKDAMPNAFEGGYCETSHNKKDVLINFFSKHWWYLIQRGHFLHAILLYKNLCLINHLQSGLTSSRLSCLTWVKQFLYKYPSNILAVGDLLWFC